VTGALLAAALAVLLWPDRRTERRRRIAAQTASRRAPWATAVPVPPAAVAMAVAVAAILSTPLVALLAGIAALTAARAWVGARRDRAVEARLSGLGEGLGALAAELRSGRPLEDATTAAVATCGDEGAGLALARAVRAPGAPPGNSAGPDDALSAALGRISAAVLLSSRTGCSLADVVTAVDEDLRARERHRRELRAATAAPRAGALLLAGLPLLGLAMGSGVGADPWGVLTTTGTGQALLVTGVLFELAGLAWSRRLVGRALR
jgi:tight adherence protein B